MKSNLSTLENQFSEILELKSLHDGLSEVMVNSNDTVWIEVDGIQTKTRYLFSYEQKMTLVKLLAGYHNLIVNQKKPSLNCKLPFKCGGRFQGNIPPICGSPFFTIRFPAARVLSIDEMIEYKTFSIKQADIIIEQLEKNSNIVVAGITGSGKTTLLNTILNYTSYNSNISDRIITIEDNPEIIILNTFNVNSLFTTQNYSVNDALFDCLRHNPSSICVGEIRDGETLLNYCRSLLTTNGSCTIHAISADSVPQRFITLAGENGLSISKYSMDIALQCIIHINKVRYPDGPDRFIVRRQVSKIITDN